MKHACMGSTAPLARRGDLGVLGQEWALFRVFKKRWVQGVFEVLEKCWLVVLSICFCLVFVLWLLRRLLGVLPPLWYTPEVALRRPPKASSFAYERVP